jgi:hypothetical protein
VTALPPARLTVLDAWGKVAVTVLQHGKQIATYELFGAKCLLQYCTGQSLTQPVSTAEREDSSNR